MDVIVVTAKYIDAFLQSFNFYHLFQSVESASLGELKLPANGATTPFVKSSKRELEIKRKVRMRFGYLKVVIAFSSMDYNRF